MLLPAACIGPPHPSSQRGPKRLWGVSTMQSFPAPCCLGALLTGIIRVAEVGNPAKVAGTSSSLA